MGAEVVGVDVVNLDIKKTVLTAFREEAAASTDPMDRWGVVNRAWKRIDDYMLDAKKKGFIKSYSLQWDGVDIVKVEYVEIDSIIVVEVNLGEKECISE